nr:golgi resident protein gcp60 [Echinococcus granulosus]
MILISPVLFSKVIPSLTSICVAHVNKAFTLTYDQNLTFSALFNQAKHGPFSPEKAPDVGIFDFIGKERRAKWQSLGTMSKAEAQDTFVQSLLQICPQFTAHLEANDVISYQDDADVEPQECNDLPPTAVHGINSHSLSVGPSQKLNYHFSPSQESQIRNALNTQTLDQFRAYAAQYYPDNEAKQAELITQLQDRHFHQYMIYISENPSALPGDISSQNSELASHASQSQSNDESALVKNQSHEATVCKSAKDGMESRCVNEQQMNEGDLVAHIPDGRDHLAAPQMWTRNDINEFKALLAKDPESVLNVGSGELVTIRVSVIPSGNCLVWEFATDDYDIGFGLSFEWPPESTGANNNSRDNGEQATPDGGSLKAPWNLIQGSSQPPQNSEVTSGSSEAVIEELIPVYRRTSHTEVYCGSHNYPASSGTYLLKFDNTYSLWRNKILYYRVYCTQ